MDLWPLSSWEKEPNNWCGQTEVAAVSAPLVKARQELDSPGCLGTAGRLQSILDTEGPATFGCMKRTGRLQGESRATPLRIDARYGRQELMKSCSPHLGIPAKQYT